MPAKKIILAITLSAISWAIILFLIYSASSCAPAPRAHYLSVTDIPSWAASPPNSDKYIYGVGYAKKQNPALGKAAAAERARTNISEQIEINISSMFLDFMHELGIGETVQAVEFTDRVTKAIKSDILTGTVIYALQNIEFNEQVTIQQTPNTLQGTVIEKTYIAKDGSVWVLVSFPIDNIIQNTSEAIKSALEEEDLYNELKASQSFKHFQSSFTQNEKKEIKKSQIKSKKTQY